MSIFSENLTSMRRKKGLTVDQVASFLDVSVDEVIDWEEGNKEPSHEQVQRLCTLLNTSEAELRNAHGFKNGNSRGFSVNFGSDGIHVGFGDKAKAEENRARREKIKKWQNFPFALICVIGFMLLGLLLDMWHPGWLIFMLIPIYHSLVSAIFARKPSYFAYPVLCALVYLAIGFLLHEWLIPVVIFLTIPVYYTLFSDKKEKRGVFLSIYPLICIAIYVGGGIILKDDWWGTAWLIFLTYPIVEYIVKNFSSKK